MLISERGLAMVSGKARPNKCLKLQGFVIQEASYLGLSIFIVWEFRHKRDRSLCLYLFPQGWIPKRYKKTKCNHHQQHQKHMPSTTAATTTRRTRTRTTTTSTTTTTTAAATATATITTTKRQHRQQPVTQRALFELPHANKHTHTHTHFGTQKQQRTTKRIKRSTARQSQHHATQTNWYKYI